MKNELLNKINAKSATVAVVGLGYVGLPLIKRLNEVGFNTLGLDIDQAKIDALTNGKPYIKHIAVADIQMAIELEKCVVTTDFSQSKNADVIILCVPTPLNKYREPDLSYVIGSLDALLPHLRAGLVTLILIRIQSQRFVAVQPLLVLRYLKLFILK